MGQTLRVTNQVGQTNAGQLNQHYEPMAAASKTKSNFAVSPNGKNSTTELHYKI